MTKSNIKSGDKLTVTFTDTTVLSSGVAKADGAVIFADGALEGDEAVIEVTEAKKNYIKADVRRLISPSPYRCEPDCMIYASCGGCSFRHAGYEYEKILKKRAVEAAFRRASLGAVTVRDTVSAKADRYRNKAVLHYDKSGKLGYYEGKTNSSVFNPDCDCALHPKEFAAVFSAVKDHFAAKQPKPTYVYLRSGKGGMTVTLGTPNGKATDGIVSLGNALMNGGYDVSGVFVGCGDSPEDGCITSLLGDDALTDEFCSLVMRVSPSAFYQVNHDAAEMLAEKASEYADAKDGELIADLYCGTGILGMVTAKNAPNAEVIGVEINEAAVINAKENAKRNGLGNISFFAGDSKDFAHHLGDRTLDAAIIDPPRKGCSTEMIGELVRLSPKRIVYVSCNPATLARDVAALTANGYAVVEATPVDMFPRTGHVESVVLMTKSR